MNDFSGIMKQLMKEKRDVILTIILGFIAGIAAVGLFAASGYLLSQAALGVPIYALTIVIALVKLLGFTRAITRYGERYFSHRATFTMLSHIRVTFFKNLLKRSPATMHRFRSGDLLSRIVADVESLQNFFLRIFYPPIVLALIFLSTILFTMFFSVWIAILLVVGMILSMTVLPAFFAARQRQIDQNIHKQRSDLSEQVTEYLFGFRDLKVHQQLIKQEEQFKRANDQYVEAQGFNQQQDLTSQTLDGLIGLLIAWLVLAVGGYLISTDQLNGVFLAMFMLITLTVFENTGAMSVFPQYWEDNKQAAARIFSKEDQSNQSSHNLINLSETPIEISFENVRFIYPNEPRLALQDLNLLIKPGSKTAIVGASGSGKSTILQLILALEQAKSGAVQINGHPIEAINPESIWKQTNTVLQESHFFHGTIRENLLPLRELSENQLAEALLQAGLEGFSLDDPVYEAGANLSGGEKQRLAIARALLRKANLWLLDEPTSSLDGITSKQVMDSIFTAAEFNTLIYVSHNLKGLEDMDQIIVLDRGQIVESGTYSELINQRGHFYQLKQIEKDTLT
ncbi:thiol reductant ABC exporter subunit CydC [Alkalibacillus aidingensis]|uniref:thiol reductant ABC exporter subunit CydC n=1 Tax=Alkalibacillus aidingensis TaxID=2747607 RepID=UPI00166179E1|nr:thiol reductant ABC exporter subunit CydC [Alkalibacillus aidingensis]